MTEQIALSFDVPARIWPELPCAFGKLRDPSTVHHCQACQAESERLQAVFVEQVAAGTYDSQGYTPAERKRKQRR